MTTLTVDTQPVKGYVRIYDQSSGSILSQGTAPRSASQGGQWIAQITFDPVLGYVSPPTAGVAVLSDKSVTFDYIPTGPQYSNVTITVTGQGSTNPPVGNYPNTYTIGSSLNVSASPSTGWQYKRMNRNGSLHTEANPGEFLNLADIENIECVFEEGTTPPPPPPPNITPILIISALGIAGLGYYLWKRKK